jgi:N-glycosylase/DNA lyase
MTIDAGWTAWADLPIRLAAPVLAEVLDGGQAFRWERQAGGSWRGAWEGSVARLRSGENGTVQWSAPVSLAAEVRRSLPRYLATADDFTALAEALPRRTDPHLAACLDAFPNLRILRQPIGETLLCFLFSATKQIVQIKQMAASIARRHGAPLGGDPVLGHRLPTWAEIAELSEDDLRKCLLGFRARHVHGTARYLAARPGWLEETGGLPYAQAKERLIALPGVGEKIADCVLLFGAGRLEAFPVDVWILRTMASRYGLEGWRPAQVAHFGRVHFGPLAGLAQQYLFAYERSLRPGRRSASER